MRTGKHQGPGRGFNRMIVIAFGLTLLWAGSGSSASAGTPLDLVVKQSGVSKVELVRPTKKVRFSMASLHTEPLLGTTGSPLELWAHRLAPGQPAVVDLVDRRSGEPALTRIPGLAATLDKGLTDFLRIRIKNKSGKVIFEEREPFCTRGSGYYGSGGLSKGPGGRSKAIAVFPGPGYAEVCGEEQAESLVWLISRRDPAFYFGSRAHRLADGEYTYELTANPDGVIPEKSLANNRFVQKFKLTSDRKRWRQLLGGPESRDLTVPELPSAGRRAVRQPRPTPLRPPTAEEIAGLPGALPDPAALPASRFGFERSRGRDQISFSSIVANLGAAPISLFGSRTEKTGKTMPGWQYLKDADGNLQRRATNGFVWDQRDTHRHWHYNKLAVYELLSMDGRVIRRSGKIGFCFMPTTALRFEPVSGALGLGTPFFPTSDDLPINCGQRRSTKVAMALQAGWGDEYFQGIAGQSLDVTDLGPGSYRLRITVNPNGDLSESNPSNNVSERLIKLGGTGNRRTLTVPRQGIVSPEFFKLAGSNGSGGRSSAFRRAGISAAGQTAAASRLLCGLAPPA